MIVSSFLVVAIGSTLAYRIVRARWVALHTARGFLAQERYECAAWQYGLALRRGMALHAITEEVLSSYNRTGNGVLLVPLKGFADEVTAGGTDVLELIGRAEYSRGAFLDSAGTYALAAARDPDRRRLHVKRARSLFYAGRLEDSVESYRLFFDAGEDDADEDIRWE